MKTDSQTNITGAAAAALAVGKERARKMARMREEVEKGNREEVFNLAADLCGVESGAEHGANSGR